MKTIRLAWLVLGGALVLPGCGSEETTLNQAEIEQIIETYILEHPETVSTSMQRFGEQSIFDAIVDAAEDGNFPILGDPEAPITLVEFVDYNCGYCRRANGWVMGLLGTREMPSDVRLIVMELPLLESRTGTSVAAASAALAAGYQGQYRSMHEKLMQLPDLSDSAIFAAARELGLDSNRLRTDMASTQTKTTLQQSAQFAEYASINGTPGFFLDGSRVSGFDQKRLEHVLAESRKKNRGG